jgi:t-SNARE complex subunit (syntaxin)
VLTYIYGISPSVAASDAKCGPDVVSVSFATNISRKAEELVCFAIVVLVLVVIVAVVAYRHWMSRVVDANRALDVGR